MSSLYIFDFDDTLANTNSHVRVIRKNGAVDRLDSRQFASYRPIPGDELDFTEFTEASGTLIDDTVDELESAITEHGVGNVYIVTARSESRPVEQFLQSMGVSVPAVVATAGSEGKATWLTKQLELNNYTSVYVYEDCRKNITMLKDIVEAYNDAFPKKPDVSYNAICILPGGGQQKIESMVRGYIRLLLEKKTQDKRLQAFSNSITRTVMQIFKGQIPQSVAVLDEDELIIDPDIDGSDIYEFYPGSFPLAIDPETIDEDFYDEDYGDQVAVTVEVDKNASRDDETFTFNVSASDKSTTGMVNFGIHIVIETIPNFPEQMLGSLRNEIANSVRHELEHVSQGPAVGQHGGAYGRGDKYWTFSASPEDVTSDSAKYLLKPEEIPAHIRGYLQNSNSIEQLENNFIEFLDGYVSKNLITLEEKDIVLNAWLDWVEANINRKKFKKNK